MLISPFSLVIFKSPLIVPAQLKSDSKVTSAIMERLFTEPFSHSTSLFPGTNHLVSNTYVPRKTSKLKELSCSQDGKAHF